MNAPGVVGSGCEKLNPEMISVPLRCVAPAIGPGETSWLKNKRITLVSLSMY
jgi:hypothetical protein